MCWDDKILENVVYGEAPKVKLIYSEVEIGIKNLQKVVFLDRETDELYEKEFRFTLTWKNNWIDTVTFIDEVPSELLWKLEISMEKLIRVIKKRDTIIIKSKRNENEEQIL